MKILSFIILSAATIISSQSFGYPNCLDPALRAPSAAAPANEASFGKFCRAFVFKVTKSSPVENHGFYFSIGTYNVPLKNGDLCSCQDWSNQGFVVACNSGKQGFFSDRAYRKSLVETPSPYCTTD